MYKQHIVPEHSSHAYAHQQMTTTMNRDTLRFERHKSEDLKYMYV